MSSSAYSGPHLYSALAERVHGLGARVWLDGACGELGPSAHAKRAYLDLIRAGNWSVVGRALWQASDRPEWHTARGSPRASAVAPRVATPHRRA